MKTPSFSPAAASAFFIHHGEKVVFALMVLLALVMLWWGVSAAQSQALDRSRTPDAVADLARQASENIQQSRSVPTPRVPPTLPLLPRVEPWRPEQVKVAATTTAPLLDRPPFTELTKRTKPEVYPISDLRAVAGVAVFPDAPPDARGGAAPQAGPVKIAPFVVVTGLIPAAKQQAEFASRFGSVSYRDPRRDNPRWAAYRVERTRVVPGAAARWELVAERNAMGPQRDDPGFGAGDRRLVRENFAEGFLLQPSEAEVEYATALPDRIDRPWGEESLHPWFIPRIRESWAQNVEQKVDTATEKKATLAEIATKPGDYIGKETRLNGVVLDTESQRQRNVGLHKFGVRSGNELKIDPATIGETEKLVFATSEEFGRKLSFDLEDQKPRPCNLVVRVDLIDKTPVARLLAIEFLDAAGELTELRKEPNPDPVRFDEDPGSGGRSAFPQGSAEASIQLAENRLFRFVDRKVVPGAEYRYRVRFALKNPNVGLAIQHVSDIAVTKGDFLFAAYSSETPTVRVPDATRILARTIPRDAARKLKVKGDSVEVIVKARSDETGDYALRSVVTGPGGMANVDPSLNRTGDTRHYGEPVTTDRLLLDIRGAQEERVDSRSTMPTELIEMLFLRPDGQFDIVTAADSESDFLKYKDTWLVEEHLPFKTSKPEKATKTFQ